MLCRDLAPGNVSDVNHSVLISGEDTLVKITFHVSLFVPHHMHGYTCETLQAILILCELVCSSTHLAAFHVTDFMKEALQMDMLGPLTMFICCCCGCYCC